MSGAVYRLSARVVGVEAAEAVLALLDAAAQAVAAFETPGREWRLDAYGEGRRLTPALAAQLACREPTGVSAAAHRPLFCPRVALSGGGAARSDRHRSRCRNRVWHGRASLDPRLSGRP